MSIYGALAENTRRNERVDRGIITVPTTGVAVLTIDPRVNVAVTQFLLAPYGGIGEMRYMTHFELAFDDQGTRQTGITGAAGAAGAFVSGTINTSTITVGAVTGYQAGTVLTINVYSFTSSANPTFTTPGITTKVRWTVWGILGSPNAAAGQYPQNF